MRDNRIGKFTLNRHMVDECPDQARAVLRDMLVLRAEAMWHRNEIEYIAAHPAFETLGLNAEPPKYVAEIRCRADGAVERVTWTKVPA